MTTRERTDAASPLRNLGSSGRLILSPHDVAEPPDEILGNDATGGIFPRGQPSGPIRRVQLRDRKLPQLGHLLLKPPPSRPR